MWVLDLADPGWLTATIRTHHRRIGLSEPPERVDLVDVRISNPHKPSSARCHGWATVRVHRHGHDRDGTLLLLRAGSAAAPAAPHDGTPLPGLPVLVWRFPADPALPALRVLTDPVAAAPHLPYGRAGLDPVRSPGLRVDVVRWQPGTSATLRVQLGTGRAAVALFAKVLADVPVGVVDAAQLRLHRAEGPPTVAEPLGADEGLGVLWTRAAPGPPLLDRLRSGSMAAVDTAAGQVASTLVGLHRSQLRPAETMSLSDQVAEAEKKAAKLVCAQPSLTSGVARVTAVALSAERDRPPDAAASRPLHGDFHAEQLLDPPDGPVLLDLDTMVRGHPEVDLAELAVDSCLRELPPGVAVRFLVGVYGAYARGQERAPDPTLLRAYTAAEFLNRCYRHLRRPVAGWQQAAADRLDRFPSVLATVEQAAATGRG